MSTSIKLKFIPSKNRNNAGVICLQLIHNRKIKLLRTRFRIFSDEWDNQAETVLTDATDRLRHIYLHSVKTGLEDELKHLDELISLLELKSDYTVDELTDLYTNHSFNGYLFPFIDYILKQLKEEKRPKTASILETTKRSLENFLCDKDILLNKIDNDLMQDYETRLRNTGMTKNTISCYMRSLRSVYNQAVRRGLTVQKKPFADIFTGVDKTVKRAVDEDVIKHLKKLDLTACPELALARDLFMFSFYMRGLSFIDMANLRKSDMKNGYINYFRSKTAQMLTVKVEACMQKIISQYESQTIDDYLLPVYSVQNRDNRSQLRTHNKRLKRISGMIGLENPLSSYVSRHSWATMALRKGYPVKVISECMGHENETTTLIYLASLEQSVVDMANAEIIRLE
jgi:site-specific recombinase XerD